MKRPLENVRPLGPVFQVNQSQEQQTEQQNRDENNNSSTTGDPIVETAEKWYNNVSKEENKRKMMRNYLRSITDLTKEEVDQKLDKSGI